MAARPLKTHSPPSHSSKTVLSIVHVGGPILTIDRTVFEMWMGLSLLRRSGQASPTLSLDPTTRVLHQPARSRGEGRRSVRGGASTHVMGAFGSVRVMANARLQ